MPDDERADCGYRCAEITPPWWNAETGEYHQNVEIIAKIVDPEAFGLSAWKPSSGAKYLTERDEARDKAAAIIKALRNG